MSKVVQENARIIPDRQTSLTKEQKEAVGLLSIGTFLEYFDLMLYVHMAVFLNNLFFPKNDPESASFFVAIAYSITFVFRPFGALLFGWIGDNIGRKVTITITTFMMATSCFIMATLPTYEQIGITASWIICICRAIQGISSLGERVGAELYLMEITKPPIQYPVVMVIAVCASLGSMVALGLGFLITNYGFNWRYLFAFGIIIATIGTVARTKLRETPEFANAKLRLKAFFDQHYIDEKILKGDIILEEKVQKKTVLFYFLIQCAGPVPTYFVYFYCGNILKNSFFYSVEDVLYHNFFISIIQLFTMLLLSYLSYRISPLKIIKVRWVIFFTFIIFCPYFLDKVSTPIHLLIIQILIILFAPDSSPASAIFYKYFPVFKRFTCSSVVYALAHATISIVTSFGFIYCTKYMGQLGILCIMLPIVISYGFGVFYFARLENRNCES
ncbi:MULTISPECIES: MFS transporter [unclassified Candidatus Tisiphia]|uniref:MFS transporter n=1 Tax=unclassified Candidatus Tisiphia TaxID=2996318 RepID=UPI003CCA9A6D